MIQPVHLADFFTVFFSAALVILFGALYALLFAYARVKQAAKLMPLAYLSYVGLFVSVLVLARAAHLNDPFWTSIVLLMLVGYLVAPHAIWRLCVDTHALEHAEMADMPAKPVFSTAVHPKRGEHHD
ncbi:MAG: hypothetical protein HY850_10080 [Betaproteobacteria bacterium]|nr:hypothetical protein [Betaproteobacteria bacterium]